MASAGGAPLGTRGRTGGWQVGTGCEPGALASLSRCLHGCLGFLTAWWTGSKSIFMTLPQKSSRITSTILSWSSNHRGSHRFKEKGHRPRHLMGRGSRSHSKGAHGHLWKVWPIRKPISGPLWSFLLHHGEHLWLVLVCLWNSLISGLPFYHKSSL